MSDPPLLVVQMQPVETRKSKGGPVARSVARLIPNAHVKPAAAILPVSRRTNGSREFISAVVFNEVAKCTAP